MFLSKSLTDTKKRYWPTELEVSGIVWVLKKVRHLVDSALRIFIFTNHSAATAIARQYHLTTTSASDKLNLKLVNTS